MKRCVVSFANTPFYQEKMKRMVESLHGKTDADVITFTSFEEVGCKQHSEIPYQFKPYSIQKVIDMGYESILWLDSPIVAVKDITPVFEHIEREGCIFFNNYGHPLGKWTNDKCLDKFGYTRDEAMLIKQIMACCMGFNVNDEEVRELIEQYTVGSNYLYKGSWDNHRHDQTVMSFLIDKFHYKIQEGHKTFFIYEHFKDVPEFQPIADSVCLISK